MALMTRWTILVTFTCALLAGCDQHIIDQMELVQTISFDTAPNHRVRSAVLIAHYKDRGQAELQLLDTESNSNYDIMPRLNTKTKDPIQYGQLRMVLFGQSYASEGIEGEINSLSRDPKIPTMLQMAVADGEGSALLRIVQKTHRPYFLSSMIEQNMRNGNLPMQNLHEILFNYYGEGRDLFLPRLKVERGEIKIDGLALFRGSKHVANIGIRESFLLKLLLDNSKNGSYMIPIAGSGAKSSANEFLLMSSIHSKVSYTVNRFEPIPSIAIDLKLKVEVKDLPDRINLRSNYEIAQLERMLESYFSQEIYSLIDLFQKNKVDPIGFGDLLRSRSRQWNEEKFYRQYAQLETKVNVKVNIAQYGLTE
ncbi:Ger(x)C family spore germination protein [Paenibacillus sp. GCM10023252]|uniref:Ger(x)C family spore germination protein n=1 Tax=Paenibacillus sp. GCM10023252 TaxID=3252649 RepID=UPI003623B0ED